MTFQNYNTPKIPHNSIKNKPLCFINFQKHSPLLCSIANNKNMFILQNQNIKNNMQMYLSEELWAGTFKTLLTILIYQP